MIKYTKKFKSSLMIEGECHRDPLIFLDFLSNFMLF